uniref:Claudin n=1 Tax=Chelonoidis abingdonii TaxID=106734 RepID=A0A8C0G5U8_CHEAB
MASAGLQILGMALSVVGWLGSIISCALPMWKVTAFIGNNIVVAQIIWEGLWMNCIVQSTGQMQCKVYDSMLALPQDLQAARALMVISVLLAVLALLVSVVGAKCTNCVEDEGTKARIMIVSGAVFVVAGILCLIPPDSAGSGLPGQAPSAPRAVNLLLRPSLAGCLHLSFLH